MLFTERTVLISRDELLYAHARCRTVRFSLVPHLPDRHECCFTQDAAESVMQREAKNRRTSSNGPDYVCVGLCLQSCL